MPATSSSSTSASLFYRAQAQASQGFAHCANVDSFTPRRAQEYEVRTPCSTRVKSEDRKLNRSSLETWSYLRSGSQLLRLTRLDQTQNVYREWCPWPDSNQHSLRKPILSRSRLPVPPQGPTRVMWLRGTIRTSTSASTISGLPKKKPVRTRDKAVDARILEKVAEPRKIIIFAFDP